MKTILVATDFSPAAANATHYAVDMAKAIGGRVFLLYVYQLPIVYMEVPLGMTESDLQEGAEQAMKELKLSLKEKYGEDLIINTEVRKGLFFSELKAISASIKPYAVVMGSQGSTATERLLFGGHTVNAVKNLPWPTVTVPPGASFKPIRKIALACDFEKVYHSIPIDEIKLLLSDFNATLHILNTGSKGSFSPEIVDEAGVLEKLLAPVKPYYHFITSDHTDEAIIAYVEKNEVDLLLALPKRHGLLDSVLHKSHTRELVLHCKVPVMALHGSAVLSE